MCTMQLNGLGRDCVKSDVLEQYWTYSLINESMINELSMFLGLITLGNQIGELFNTSFLETIIKWT